MPDHVAVTCPSSALPEVVSSAPLRLGFLGAGWIGRHRMQALCREAGVIAAAICDPSSECLQEALSIAPHSRAMDTFEELLRQPLDGIVIATPSALHATQSVHALEAGFPVFCQKPLARTAPETQWVIDAAKRANRLLGVDLSYRYVNGVPQMRERIRNGDIGRVFAADLVFHNAYGPGKPWFFDPILAGGGCLIDLGIHLVDLAFWMLEVPGHDHVSSTLFHHGEPVKPDVVEDFALAQLRLPQATVLNLACSWNLPAGRDAVIEATFYGTRGALALRNVNGSFLDFTVEHFRGTQAERLASPPDDWGGRAAAAWAGHLARHGNHFDDGIETLVPVAAALDAIYRAAGVARPDFASPGSASLATTARPYGVT
jgi:predicted dehydrogenase